MTGEGGTVEFEHVLVIGGTGMLRGATVALASCCSVLTSVARSERSLAEVRHATSHVGVAHHTLALDWARRAAFLRALLQHVGQVGRPALVLAWLHDDHLGPLIAEAVASPDGDACEFFQVRGSAAAAPGADPTTLLPPHRTPAGVRFHQVILGFHLDDEGSRWLTHAEISSGVLAAIARREDLMTVGVVTPWSARP